MPAVGLTWYEHGPQVGHALILRLLEQQRAQGRIAPDTSLSNLPQINSTYRLECCRVRPL